MLWIEEGVGVEDVDEYCAGLDVHRDTVVATVRYPEGGRRSSTTRTFGTDTAELVALGDWLVSWQVTRVGLESTGVYWKPVFYQLEDRFEQVWLLNAQHLKTVPGRKTDVARFGVDRPTRRARSGAAVIRAAASDPPVAGFHPAAPGAQ